MDVSIVIRTYNEAAWLPHVFDRLARQRGNIECEVIVVDSGSTDDTIEIARQAGARVVFIRKDEFSFGRSLNVGCAAATGRNLVFISGHCLPASTTWLRDLVAPLDDGRCVYSYGRQIGDEQRTKFSESQLFAKFFPATDRPPSDDIHCNNANAALRTEIWREHRFDEALTGLEDMELARRLVARGLHIGYVASAPVIHIHEESWGRVRIRFEREAAALRHILPEVHVSLADAVRYAGSGIVHDFGAALRQGRLLRVAREIVLYRAMQYWGTYRGNAAHRALSRSKKEEYFYPRPDRRTPAESLPEDGERPLQIAA